jgi:hypothetical protein
MDVINLILAGVALSTILATIAASFYGVRQKTIIATLKESNDAYKERNQMIEQENAELKKSLIDQGEQHTKDLAELRGRIITLEKIKTPPLEPLMKLINDNHAEVMAKLQDGGVKL